jgi:DNA-binding IscR family transcriptional regulator
MSDNQRFPMAAHILAYLAHKDASSRDKALSSTLLAATMPTNPVVVRRLIVSLSKAGLIKTCSGAFGGAWLAVDPKEITLDTVLIAVDGFAHIGSVPLGAEGCPVSQAIPKAIAKCLKKADLASRKALSETTIMDLLKDNSTSQFVA